MPRGKPIDQCITIRCGGKQFAKGLCRTCYNAALSLIGRQLTSWDELATFELTNEATGAKFLQAFDRKTGNRRHARKEKDK